MVLADRVGMTCAAHANRHGVRPGAEIAEDETLHVGVAGVGIHHPHVDAVDQDVGLTGLLDAVAKPRLIHVPVKVKMAVSLTASAQL